MLVSNTDNLNYCNSLPITLFSEKNYRDSNNSTESSKYYNSNANTFSSTNTGKSSVFS